MFKSSFTLLILFIVSAFSIKAQDSGIYIPVDIQKVYNGGTRSWDGTPGPDYWQNSADYFLKVELNPDSGLVSGEGTIIYYNNSPDTLDKIVMRLYQDIFKKGIARDYGLNPESFTEGTKLKKLIVDGVELDPDTAGRRTYTNYILKLPNTLSPQNKVEIEIGWEFTLTENQKLRMGNYRPGAYFVAYWYPQVAVYDDIDGWDMTEYTGQVEFYNDFNNYDVEITVPENYLVRATGEMLNADDILRVDIYERYSKALNSDEVVRIITTDDLADGITKSGNQTYHYKAENVSDFSFAAVKDYLWDGASVVVDDETGRRTFTDVLYREEDTHFDKGVYYSQLTVEYLSKELPGVPFPYSHITSFCNGGRRGGMETPMMTNDGAPKDSTATLSLLFHEIAHTYFPFYMGINERKYAWMDEGWASFFPTEVTHRYNPEYSHYIRNKARYIRIEGTESEIPLMILSKYAKGFPLLAAIYNRAYFAYVSLQSLLGDGLFKKAMQEYIKRWHGKHPLPYDFFFTFNDVAGEDLSWFWNPWFYNSGYCDVGLGKSADGKVIVELVGNRPVEAKVKVVYDDGSEEVIKVNTNVWKTGKRQVVIHTNERKKIISANLMNEKIPDINPDNDSIKF